MGEPGGDSGATDDAAATQAYPPAPSGAITPAGTDGAPAKLAWWRRGWGVAAIGVVCLLIGLGIGASGSSKKKEPAKPTPAQLAAAAVVTKEHLHEEGVARAATEKREAAERAAQARAAARVASKEAAERHHEEAQEHAAEARKHAEESKTFTGNGSENLGTINVTTASTLHWSCPGCTVFGINAATSGYTATIGVDSSNHSEGVTAVEPGTYHSVDVISDEGESASGWTIHITPSE
jgi:hypothetical protein